MPLVLDNKRIIDLQLLLLLPVMVLLSTLLPEWVDTRDLVQYYAWYVLLIQLMMLYTPTHVFISKRGGASAFGIKRVSAAELLWAILLGVGMCCLTNALEQALQLLYAYLGANSLFTGSLLTIDGGWRLPALVILIAVIPAYAEESLFRGALLFSWLPKGKARAIIHSALLFSLVHLNPVFMPSVFVLGLTLSMASVWSGSCVPAVAMHCVNNIIAVVGSYALGNLSPAAQASMQALGTGGWMLYNGVAGFALTALSLPLFRRAAKKGAARREEAAALNTGVATAQTVTPQEATKAYASHTSPSASENKTPSVRLVFIRPSILFSPKLPVVITYAFLISINLLLLAMAFIPL